MGKSSAPAAPDPYTTAAAQTGANRDNAAYLAALNRMNTYTPTGSQTYTNQGTDPTTGAPIYTQNVTLSPEQQALYNSNTANQLNQSGFAGSALDAARNSFQPLNEGSTQNVQDALYKQNTQYLDPQFKRDETSMDAKLAAQGITPGSEAWKNQMDEFAANKDQAYSGARNAAITGATAQRGQNIQQDIALQNQPLNYYNALMSGAQAQQPQFGQPSNISTNPADITSAINNNYQAQVGQVNAQNASTAQTEGSIASLLAMYMMSDERLKHDIHQIGEYAGFNLYRFKYHGSDQVYIGVMAQEVLKQIPDAVVEHEGYLMVNYHALH